jgi:hypothetical protein
MRSDRTSRLLIVTVVSLAALAPSVLARNVDLSTVPPRDSVQLTIYNSEDLTLVRESRSLSLKKGINRIQYSWANTLIDPTSVEIRPVEKEDQIEILDTTFPGDKPQHLIWNIQSEIEGQAQFQVTYFTSGLSWSADYVLIADPDETQLSFDGYVQVYNNSGEEYENAQVRLVVGVVNLVEKIEELARQGVIRRRAGEPVREEHRRMALRGALADAASMEAAAGRPAEIVKEGLSEYFIYTIEGRQTIPNQWSRRMLSFQARQVDFDIVYRVRPYQYGGRPVRFFMLENDEEHKLGTTPLPDGLVRTFRENGRDGLSFLGQQKVSYVPIKEDIELNVGTDDEVVWERKRMNVARSNFKFGGTRNRQVVGWDEAFTCREELRNHRAEPIRVEVRHVIDGDVELEAEGARLHDFRTVEFAFAVEPGRRLAWQYEYTQHMAENAGQSRIKLR